MDAFEQMELQRQREARQRIVERFLRLILVGFVLDALKGSGEDSTKEDKKKKGNSKSSAGSEGLSVKSIKEKANTYGGPAVMFAFIVAMLAIRAAEEGYHPADHDEHEFNYYEVMGLTKGVDQMEIRKAYKALALKYHPDKNPDCSECAEKFGKISKAYVWPQGLPAGCDHMCPPMDVLRTLCQTQRHERFPTAAQLLSFFDLFGAVWLLR
ncbi:unnamed protein product [Durusdinium trenchii]|uniref:Chaperone protein DnaJ n=2 Tax=Durusdinium trenchii TaxID=1381693 RepID=A0ABP0RB91_9DINO